jgi:hypothetical protein
MLEDFISHFLLSPGELKIQSSVSGIPSQQTDDCEPSPAINFDYKALDQSNDN